MHSIEQHLNRIAAQINHSLLMDRAGARRELDRLRHTAANGPADGDAHFQQRCARLAQRIEASAGLCRSRRQPRDLFFDPNLPITAKKDELIESIRNHPVLIVAGETGSGKTTQLPKLCLAAGRGIYGTIAVTQPRRIAAITVGNRIAEELDETVGRTVGCKIRFSDTSGPRTQIKIMTDGILLAETHRDPLLYQYDTLIVDEAHERSLNIDFILGILVKLLARRRDLKVIITSATIDTGKFSEAFGDAPVIKVSGRLYPVDTRYLSAGEAEEDETGHVEAAVRAVDELMQQRRRGDILVFMPTEQDIRDTCDLLEGRSFDGTRIMPLFARLSAAEQQRVFQSDGRRKIVVATNVAETSITIPGIHYVVDSGLARISQYAPRSRTTTLPVVPISQSSADQRQGRCGRVAKGVCIRLYSEADYLQRPRYTPPEIQRANLAEVILRMIALDLGDVEHFPFVDPPAPRSIQDGYRLLLELGAIRQRGRVDRKGSGKYILTERGRLMARLPLDPRLARMLLAAHENGCLDEMTVIAAALSIQDPRERPVEKQAQADAAHARFADPGSDFITLLRIWQAYTQCVAQRTAWSAVKKFCRDHFLSFRRLREWRDVYDQLQSVLAEHHMRPKQPPRLPDGPSGPADAWYAAVHRSILSGFLSNIAMHKEKQIFQAAYSRQAMIFPGSGLFRNPGRWIVAAEMVETSRLFARSVAVIDPAWIEAVGKELCTYSYSDPHWERRREQVTAIEQVSLFGLVIDRRTRPYGPVNPGEAGEIFIRQALIAGDVRRPLPFMVHNSALTAEIEALEDRLRRRDLLVEEEALVAFYQRHLEGVYDLPTLKKRIREAGGDAFLRLRREDVLNTDPPAGTLAQYPDEIEVGCRTLKCEYRFDPGHEADGVTIRVQAPAAGSLRAASMQWLVPGLLAEKIAALLKALPKDLRRQLLPLSDTAAVIAREMPVQRDTHLAEALSAFIRRRFDVAIPPAAWNENALPDHLRMRIAITGEGGRIVRSSRDAAVLQEADRIETGHDAFKSAVAAYERSVRTWDFGDLPETITLQGADGRCWQASPALVPRDGDIVLTALADPERAAARHVQGVRTLLLREFHSDVKYLRKNLALPASWHAVARRLGGHAELTAQLQEQVVDALMARNVRSAVEFDALRNELRACGIAGQGRELWHALLDILQAYQDILDRIGPAAPPGGPLRQHQEALNAELNRLIPPNFILLYDRERLAHLPRYLKALALRAERARIDLEKDKAKQGRVAPFAARLAALAHALTPESSAARRKAVEDLFWAVEEFKISVYAPEVKTSRPISAKRLEEQIALIEAMAG